MANLKILLMMKTRTIKVRAVATVRSLLCLQFRESLRLLFLQNNGAHGVDADNGKCCLSFGPKNTNNFQNL
jgi:hypothetical protein